MRAAHLKELKGNIFVREAMLLRVGLKKDDAAEDDLDQGRNDQRDWVVSTTHFHATLPADVPLRGVIELGVNKEQLKKAVEDYGNSGGVQCISGTMLVNNVACIGELTIDFKEKTGELMYLDKKN